MLIRFSDEEEKLTMHYRNGRVAAMLAEKGLDKRPAGK